MDGDQFNSRSPIETAENLVSESLRQRFERDFIISPSTETDSHHVRTTVPSNMFGATDKLRLIVAEDEQIEPFLQSFPLNKQPSVSNKQPSVPMNKSTSAPTISTNQRLVWSYNNFQAKTPRSLNSSPVSRRDILTTPPMGAGFLGAPDAQSSNISSTRSSPFLPTHRAVGYQGSSDLDRSPMESPRTYERYLQRGPTSPRSRGSSFLNVSEQQHSVITSTRSSPYLHHHRAIGFTGTPDIDRSPKESPLPPDRLLNRTPVSPSSRAIQRHSGAKSIAHSATFRVNLPHIMFPPISRFFVIKSYTPDDVHKSIKYGVWASTEQGNKRLDEAYQESQVPLHLLFSINSSGCFCGVAVMTGPVDFDKAFTGWSMHDKWTGLFPVKWIYVKDVSNKLLAHITLSNNGNKPITTSRNTQEVPFEEGMQVVQTFASHECYSSILENFEQYDQDEATLRKARDMAKPNSVPSPLPPSSGRLIDSPRGEERKELLRLSQGYRPGIDLL